VRARTETRAHVQSSIERRRASRRARLLTFVHLSGERALEPMRKDSSFAEKQQPQPVRPLVVSMKEGVWSSAVGAVIRVRGQSGGGERCSCLYRLLGGGLCEMGGLVPAAQFH